MRGKPGLYRFQSMEFLKVQYTPPPIDPIPHDLYQQLITTYNYY